MILDGKYLSNQIAADLSKRAAGRHAKLAVLLAGSDPASVKYVNAKRARAAEVEIACDIIKLPDDVSETEILTIIEKLNKDDSTTGIMTQLPLPPHLDADKITNAVDPDKDVDGLGRAGKYLPATVRGIERLLEYYLFGQNFDLDGRVAVIVGAGELAGKPAAKMLLRHGATTIVCHDKTKDLRHWTRQADILIAAAGCKNLIQPGDIKEGVILIDVGCDAAKECYGKAAHYSPVPGGVGPMTIISLLENTIDAIPARQIKQPLPAP
ncbi:MAG: bifunctional 5,10-methylenetetrahydrofolate dehydrogenase/5,10-methenyltetrahydrofolate cyclohydrolase [Rickettsiales bacterium]|jgi:methylenetetrahydrofolate dehydrogenase (NADP+)/methenyltetrahydrofolate cyclohydrolase|nr:bifunctional 5,10-methylenetetrahydrofolate dehydrogenase/5,10-methenyltetrahydrofolate cyclohydrolase [Rickettsiales bacterium]